VRLAAGAFNAVSAEKIEIWPAAAAARLAMLWCL
jgi:hypothetical protein